MYVDSTRLRLSSYIHLLLSSAVLSSTRIFQSTRVCAVKNLIEVLDGTSMLTKCIVAHVA